PEVDAQISHEFAAAVYRVGHSLISQNIEIKDAQGNTISVPLTSAFLNPTNDDDAVKDGYLDYLPAVRPDGFEQRGVDGIIEGIISQPAEEVDFNIVDAVRNDLVNIRADLFAFNVARGWDVGLGTMNQVRADLMASDDPYVREAVERSGEDLSPYTSWEDFRDRNGLSAAVIAQFIAAYPDLAVAAEDYDAFAAINGDIGEEQSDGSYMVKGIDRVDLWVGGLAEEHINGGMVGSTFWVVLHEQFDRLQEGDRFYYLSRVDDFDFYGHVKEQTFADIVARNTGIEGLPEDIFSTDARSDTSTTTATDQNDNPDDSTDTINDGNGTDTGNDNNGPDNGDAMPFVAAMLLTGDAGSNTLVGNTNGDILAGLEGNDALLAGEGDNVVYAGDGNDEVITGSGNDIVLGGDGNDMIMTGDGNDIIDGGLGRDLVQAGDGDDLVLARFDDGNDVYNGGLGNDTIDLSAITAAATIDLGIGRVSSDQTGSDMISGFENAVGGQGNDLIIANGEVNVLTGGHGEDTFEFRSAAGANNDSITDFEQGDSINLSGVFGGQDVTFMEGTTFAPGGQVIIYSEGDDAIIEGDADNDGNADFAITLVGRADLGEFTP
ncbi:MAG: Ca2+-binding RTX toxin-like protein, partial [Alphaproteobacteria bacterium]